MISPSWAQFRQGSLSKGKMGDFFTIGVWDLPIDCDMTLASFSVKGQNDDR